MEGIFIFKAFDIFWDAYENKELSLTKCSVDQLDEKRIFYHKTYGYTYLKSSTGNNISDETRIRLAVPGISWDDEYDDYISGKVFQADLIPIFQTKIKMSDINKHF